MIEHSKHDGKWGSPQCGLGYGGKLTAAESYTFSASVTGDFVKVQFHDGNEVVATVEHSPWKVERIKLAAGLRVLFAVGTKANGQRQASRPAFTIVESIPKSVHRSEHVTYGSGDRGMPFVSGIGEHGRQHEPVTRSR